MDQNLFQNACEKVINAEREKNGIGTLGEKTLHAVLKYYFEPDEKKHEIKVNRFVADIATKESVVEIQTRNFSALRRKLSAFLETKEVTVVYPIPYIKYLQWINVDTGEVGKQRKSPRKGTPYMVFPELYKIKEYLLNPNFNLCIVMVNLQEYRMLNGWSQDKKKGSTRFDRVPIALQDEIYICSPKDYYKLIPISLKDGFTSREFSKEAKVSLSVAQTSLNILYHMDAVKRVGKKGNCFIYERNY